jgi:prepilin-type N-terminal cleavage/methylation domain-containing protein
MKTSSQTGFTLAELLIALALLGVIAAFTIPKVLEATGTQQATAQLKEAASTLESAWYNQKLQNSFSSGNSLATSVIPALNTASSSTAGSAFGANGPMVTLQAAGSHACNATYIDGYAQFANGAIIMFGPDPGLSTYSVIPAGAAGNVPICIDTNGINGPNQVGVDVFVGEFNQWGNFDGTGTINLSTANQLGTGSVYTGAPSPTNKNFNWGSPIVSVANVGCIMTNTAYTYSAAGVSSQGGALAGQALAAGGGVAATTDTCAAAAAWIARAGNMMSH